MTAACMRYSVLVGGRVAVAASALAQLLAIRGVPRRAPWIAALFTATLVPVAVATRPPTVASSLPRAVMASTTANISQIWREHAGWPLDRSLLATWLVATMLMAALVASAAWRLHRVAKDARRTMLDGELVGLTECTGPGARYFGVPRSFIPSWLESLDPYRRTLLLRHEREHVRSGDPQLLLCGVAAVSLMPWNPAL
ncbi:MAG: hypothetical protein ABI910_16785 [Gemmatimonadota bacterium]